MLQRSSLALYTVLVPVITSLVRRLEQSVETRKKRKLVQSDVAVLFQHFV